VCHGCRINADTSDAADGHLLNELDVDEVSLIGRAVYCGARVEEPVGCANVAEGNLVLRRSVLVLETLELSAVGRVRAVDGDGRRRVVHERDQVLVDDEGCANYVQRPCNALGLRVLLLLLLVLSYGGRHTVDRDPSGSRHRWVRMGPLRLGDSRCSAHFPTRLARASTSLADSFRSCRRVKRRPFIRDQTRWWSSSSTKPTRIYIRIFTRASRSQMTTSVR
jgi:hypothetical protein